MGITIPISANNFHYQSRNKADYMNSFTPEAIRQHLSKLQDPELGFSYSDKRVLRELTIDESQLNIRLVYPYLTEVKMQQRQETILKHIQVIWPDVRCKIEFKQHTNRHKVQNSVKPKFGVKNIIAVASGKGGVGKSTVALNLALGLQALGARVAILDADIYGPSLPRMLGQVGIKAEADGKNFVPVEGLGLQSMSMGYLVDEQTPMIWRGPMVSSALQQLLNDTAWQSCDYMILDLPPGTGDIQLTMAQKIPLSGAVVVTTPQDIALADVYKAYKMFEKLKIPVLGVIENMSYHTCSECGHEEHIFGSGGGDKLVKDFGLDLLAQIPLSKSLREKEDLGEPVVTPSALTEDGQRFVTCAEKVAIKLACEEMELQAPIQKIKVSA